MRVAVIGGDVRNELFADILAKDGVEIARYGLQSGNERSLARACFGADIVVGPTPFIRDGVVNAPFYDDEMEAEVLLREIPQGAMFIAGSISPASRRKLTSLGIKYADWTDDEEFVLGNAIPSAEGAIEIAMRRMDTTLHGSNALVLGYGRIGKVLCRMLCGIGAVTSVYARREASLGEATGIGALPVTEGELPRAIGEADVIINTIPSLVLNAERLNRVRERTLIIDLASAPGGTDFTAAREQKKRAYLELGLPGKVAPRSAAQYMAEAFTRLCNKEK